jgi:general secretion pathway protein H
MTLIEVLIVVALIAMLMGTLFFGSGMLTSSRQRAAGSLIISVSRLAVTRANTTGNPVRIVFDLEQERVFLEESTGRMLRQKPTTRKADPSAGAEASTEAEKEAREEADRIMEGPSAPRASFRPSPQLGPEGRELGTGVEFRQVQTQHDAEPLTEGRAYLYFWPGGETEHAAIQIQRKGDPDADDTLTVVVSALTARAKIKRGRLDLPEPRSDGDISERDEE